MRSFLVICAGLAGASVLLLPAAPSYDATMWLLWGRELAGGSLDTTAGPAFKPGPVALSVLLAPLGGLAPDVWLVVARGGLVAAVGLAALLAKRLGGSRVAAATAGTGVALTGSLAPQAGTGNAEALLVALLLGAALAHLDGRMGTALALAAAGALIRIETVPLLAVYGALVTWRSRPVLRPALVAGAVALPALWLVPDWLSSGELLRSAERARVPSPGQPARAALPALESARGALSAALVPVALGAVFLRPGRDRLAVAAAAAGAGWVALVAAMAELGFSGEARYALPGIALVTVAGAAGLGRAVAGHPGAAPVVAALVLLAALPRLAGASAGVESLTATATFAQDLRRAIAAAGGREALLNCGPPAVGRYRGPMAAYALRIARSDVVFTPRGAGAVLRSRLPSDPATTPVLPAGYSEIARDGGWSVAVRRPGSQRRFCSRARSSATAATAWPIAR